MCLLVCSRVCEDVCLMTMSKALIYLSHLKHDIKIRPGMGVTQIWKGNSHMLIKAQNVP